MSSPDGATVQSTQPAMVKRELRPSEGLIIETMVLEGGEPRTTTLTQSNGANIFTATDDANSFTGKVTFAPNPWKAISWVYDLEMTDGSGSLEGTATMMPNGITIMRFFVGPDGERQAQLIDKLQNSTEEEFEAASSGE